MFYFVLTEICHTRFCIHLYCVCFTLQFCVNDENHKRKLQRLSKITSYRLYLWMYQLPTFLCLVACCPGLWAILWSLMSQPGHACHCGWRGYVVKFLFSLKESINRLWFKHAFSVSLNCVGVVGSMEIQQLRSRYEEQSAVAGNLSTSFSSDMVILNCSHWSWLSVGRNCTVLCVHRDS